MFPEHQNIRPVAHMLDHRSPERRARADIRHERPIQSLQRCGEAIGRVRKACNRNRLDTMHMHHHLLRHHGMERGFDRRPQRRARQVMANERAARFASGIAGRKTVQHRGEIDRYQDWPGLGLHHPRAARLHPHHTVLLERDVAAGTLDHEPIPSQACRERDQVLHLRIVQAGHVVFAIVITLLRPPWPADPVRRSCRTPPRFR
jgi:hypothetical protein